MSKKNDLIFEERLAAAEEELKWLYMELYDDEEAYDYFLTMLKDNFEHRKPALKKLDEQRLKEPDWYKRRDLLGMLMYVQAFGRTGPEWNGTLKGVREHLDYLKETGINYLHLMPILESPEGRSDGGYAVSDFRNVDPKLGTMKDLEALADDCRKNGMSLCLDFVMNHTSEDHAWAKAARAGDPLAQSRYFFYDNWDIPNEYEKTVPEVFPQTAPGNFSWCEEAGKVVMTTFYPYQWDLNYKNPIVLNDMTDNMLFLCNRGVDVIRLDAVPYIWKELGTRSRNLPEVHKLVRIMHLAADIVCPAPRRSRHGALQGGPLLRHRGETGMPDALQRDHHGQHLAHGCHPGRPAPPPPAGDGLRAPDPVHVPKLPPVPRRHRLGPRLRLPREVRHDRSAPQEIPQ